MSGHALKKTGHVWERIKQYAPELSEFKTAELSEKMNKHITKRGFITKIKVNNGRLASILDGHPQIKKVGTHNGTGNQVWRWIGDDE